MDLGSALTDFGPPSSAHAYVYTSTDDTLLAGSSTIGRDLNADADPGQRSSVQPEPHLRRRSYHRHDYHDDSCDHDDDHIRAPPHGTTTTGTTTTTISPVSVPTSETTPTTTAGTTTTLTTTTRSGTYNGANDERP